MNTEEMQAQAQLFAKLARVMGKVRHLPKTGYNEHFRYNFVTDGTVSDAVSTALASENVAFIPSILESRLDGKITKTRFLFTFACGDTGAIFQAMWEGEGMDNQDKGVSKSATSAVKYFLLKTFLIDTGDKVDDPDNDMNNGKQGKNAEAKPVQPKHQQRQESPTATPVAFDATSGPAFVEWAVKSFAATPEQINDALKRRAPELQFIQQWPATVNEAVAAIIAASVEYDKTRLLSLIANYKRGKTLKKTNGEPYSDAQLETFKQFALKLIEV